MVLGSLGIVYGFLMAPKTTADVEAILEKEAAEHHGRGPGRCDPGAAAGPRGRTAGRAGSEYLGRSANTIPLTEDGRWQSVKLRAVLACDKAQQRIQRGVSESFNLFKPN